MLTKAFLLKEFHTAKEKGDTALYQHKYRRALDWYHFAGNIAWNYPIVFNFIDSEIESSIKELTKKLFQPYNFITDGSEKILIYSSWLGDNGALIEQYLDYFIKSNLSVLLIVPSKKQTNKGKAILKKIELSENVSLYIPKKQDIISRIKSIREQIQGFKPTKSFLHFYPNDVIGISTFCDLKNTRRFLINHGDHLFWYGKNCTDYIIEFRNFGISLSVQRRGFDPENILHIPFYPIINNIAFKGLPFASMNKIVGISGANLYKYYLDKDLKYFKIIIELLKENADFIFCLCGVGDAKKILELVKLSNVEDRFFFLGYRSDFYELIGNCHILFESYPLKGGLTLLFATQQNIPVIGISTNYNASGSTQDILGLDNYVEPANLTEFKIQATKLIKDQQYRQKISKILNNNDYNQTSFIEKMDLLMRGELMKLTPKILKDLGLDDEQYLTEYLSLPGANLENFKRNKLMLLKSTLSLREKVSIVMFLIRTNNVKTFREIYKIAIALIS